MNANKRKWEKAPARVGRGYRRDETKAPRHELHAPLRTIHTVRTVSARNWTPVPPLASAR
ncbi:hypothetical protein JCM17961_20470 [Endothiovibrio diazotrophicus]